MSFKEITIVILNEYVFSTYMKSSDKSFQEMFSFPTVLSTYALTVS